MPDDADLKFVPLTPDAADSACALSTQAGWEQTREDWLRMTRLPDSGVWTWSENGTVRASFSLAGYGSELAWVGMILVDEALRGRGVGKAAFSAVLEKARERSFKTLGLDATDMGEPIYRKFGFQTTSEIVRWQGLAKTRSATSASPVRLHEGIIEWDRQATGLDRSGLLRDLAASGAQFFSLETASTVRGYGVLKRGRTAWHFGPVTAASASDFEDLLNSAAGVAAGESMICDALQDAASPSLLVSGLKPHRRLRRMMLPAGGPQLTGPHVWCGAGLELG